MKLVSESVENQSEKNKSSVRSDDRLGHVTDSNIAQPAILPHSNGMSMSPVSTGTAMAAGKPLIQPARLKVRKRRLSINSATAALSLAGSRWSLDGHVTEKANGDWSMGGRKVQPPSLSLTNWHSTNGRTTSARTSQQSSNFSFRNDNLAFNRYGRRNGTLRFEPHSTADSNGLANHSEKANTPQHSVNGLNLSGANLPLTSARTDCCDTQPSITDNRQPQMMGVVNSNKYSKPVRRISCSVLTLLLLSLSVNVVLLFMLVVCAYRPCAESAIF